MQYTLVNRDGESNLTVFVAGKQPLTAHSSNPHFEEMVAKVLADDESALDLFDLAQAAATRFELLSERISIKNGHIYLDGEEVHNALATQIIRFISEGVEDWKPLVRFFENVQTNPNDHSREQLFSWLDKRDFTITDEGLIVGYKGVAKAEAEGVYLSTTAGDAVVNGVPFTRSLIPQSVGDTVTMPRSEVAHNPAAACSVGLHVGSHDFAAGYGSTMLEVHVNPRDVVSVPNDSGSAKMRVCRYVAARVLGPNEESKPYSVALITVPAVEPKAIEPVAKPEPIAPSARAAKKVVAAKKVEAKKVEEVRVGDVYEDTDKRRAGRTVKVKSIDLNGAIVVDNTDKKSAVKVERLQSRAFKRIKRGRKK